MGNERTRKLDPAEGSTDGECDTGSHGLLPTDGESPRCFGIFHGCRSIVKECLAAVRVIKKFQYLVWGCEIIAVIDHYAFCWLQSKKELARRLVRWATVIQGENLRIVHKYGKLLADDDSLSSYPTQKSK